MWILPPHCRHQVMRRFASTTPPGYQADNVRSVRLEAVAAIPIAVVVADPTGAVGGLYVERALTVAGAGREFDVDVRDGREVAARGPTDLSRMAAMFVLGTRTLDRSGRELIKNYLAGGGQVFLAMGPDVDPGTLADVLGVELSFDEAPVRTPGATMIASDGRHPIFRPFLNPSGALGDVQVEQHRRLNDQDDRTVLARFSGGDAALTEQTVGQGRLVVFTSDLDNEWSRFPLNPAFVPFAVETARYLTRNSSLARRGPEGAKAAESNPAATTVEEFTNAIERTKRAGLREAGSTARDLEDRQRWWQIGLRGDAGGPRRRSVVGREQPRCEVPRCRRRVESFMADRAGELRAILAGVRARWSRRAFLRAWMLGAVTAAAMLMVGLLAVLAARAGRHPAGLRRRHRRPGRRASRCRSRCCRCACRPPIARSRASSKSRPAVSTKWSSPRSTRARRCPARSSIPGRRCDSRRSQRRSPSHRHRRQHAARRDWRRDRQRGVCDRVLVLCAVGRARDRRGRLVPVSRTTTRSR